MDNTTCRILLLPLEIRQQIYSLCFDDERPQPSLLQLNKSTRYEATQFLRKWKQTYTYNISARGAGFDDSAQWRFKIKGHVPRLSRMKHIIVNIEPPRLKMQVEMWNIWHHVHDFCKELAPQEKIQRLTINFVETQTAQWETDGVPHSSWDIGSADKDIDDIDIGQLLLTFGYLVHVVVKLELSIPGTYMVGLGDGFGDTWIDRIERYMTGLWEVDEEVCDKYELMEDDIELLTWDHIQEATGKRSVAVFREMFGSTAVLSLQDLERFKETWPYMDDLWAIRRPRYRIACSPYCQCRQTMVEVSLPDPAWLYQDLERAEQWHREELVVWGKISRCKKAKKFPIE